MSVILSLGEWQELLCRRPVESANSYRTPPLPPWPTEAEPGSAAKIDLMMLRAKAGYQVFHPGDITIEQLKMQIALYGRRLRNGSDAKPKLFLVMPS